MKTKDLYKLLIAALVLINYQFSFAQNNYGKSYKINKSKSIFLPLGIISFADSVVDFTMGNPAPFKKFSDPSQSLHEPNYITYSYPNYVSVGCRGVLTVAFTDNGFMNLPGNDLYIFEVGPSEEAAKIEISNNGIDWIFAGNITGGKSTIDLNDEGISSEIVYYYLRITDLKKVCNSKTAGADIDAIGAINSVIKISINADILFDTNQFSLKESASQLLDSLAKKIQKVKKATLFIEGHTDSDGDAIYNKNLSENRCLSVRDKLIQLFNEDALYDYEIKYFGEERPKVSNDTPENMQLNRRVEITILPPKDYYKFILKKE